MYYYIVDTGNITQRQFERVQSQLYSSITLYKISGEIVRTTGIRTIKQLVETAFFHQAKTIVAVGSDDTLNEVINHVGNREIAIGYIPLIDSELSSTLGISDIASACKNLGMRRIMQFDLGSANGQNFMTRLTFGMSPSHRGFDFLGMKTINQLSTSPTFEIQFKADDNYSGSAEILGGVIINNKTSSCDHSLGSPSDGLLDVVLIPKLTKTQLIYHRSDILNGCFETLPNASGMNVKKLEITTSAIPIMAGDTELTKSPVIIEVKPAAVKMIVGRDRKF
jgi:diacylglycerol kinase family enzyme